MARATTSVGLLVLGLLASAASARADDAALGAPPFPHVRAEGYVRVGATSGFLQTPKGGQPGTTTERRPALDEIGADLGEEIGVRAETAWRRHEVHLDLALLLLGGSDKLRDGFVSQGATFGAGTSIDSSSWIGRYRLGYAYRFDLPLGRAGCLVVRPGASLEGLHVHDRLTGEGGASVRRTYLHVAPALDLRVGWRPAAVPRVFLEAGASQTLSFLYSDASRMNTFESTLRVGCDLSSRTSLYVETGFRRSDWRDAQTVPNHVHVTFGPWFGVGFTYRF